MKNWQPFRLGPKADALRSLKTPEGVADRLRIVAFAEKQAMEAFKIAPQRFPDVSERVQRMWRILAAQEAKHLRWLMERLQALGAKIDARAVSLDLWKSFMRAQTAQQFAHYMKTAEERGQVAGERLMHSMHPYDPESACLLGRIAKEEIAHIRAAETLFIDPCSQSQHSHG
jgi:uncharacterized ferritin-like protein (DUF455 family)